MAKMFREYTDDNGVTTSCNAHPTSDFTHPPAAQRPAHPHWMAGEDGHGGYLEPAAETLVHKAKDRFLGRPNAMTFEGDLLPRSERVSQAEAGRGVEKHAPGCYCALCQPPMQAAVSAPPAKTYRK